MGYTIPYDPFLLRRKLTRCIMVPDYFLAKETHTMFNANEYSEGVKAGTESCRNRYEAVLVYLANTVVGIRKTRESGFQGYLSELNGQLPIRGDLLFELTYPDVVAEFEALLVAVKALLDALCAHLLAARVGNSPRGFNKDGSDVGGRVLNFLRNESISRLPRRDDLVRLIEDHKATWINELVGMRDRITHSGALDCFIGCWIVAKGGRAAPYTADDVYDPLLRLDGGLQTVEEYALSLRSSVGQFTAEFRDILYPPEERQAILASGRRAKPA